MTLLLAIVLGLVQGLTEFIPVSSSGHLVVANAFFDAKDSFAFDVLLNFGTLAALTVYYRKRILGIISLIVVKRQFELAAKLIAATIPAVAVGFLLEDFFTGLNDNLLVVIAMLAIVGLVFVLFGKEQAGSKNDPIESIPLKKFVIIGIAQAFALIPGTSRSGITILAGLRQSMTAERAAELSFMLAIPTIFGASLKTLLGSEGQRFITDHLGMVILGNVVSFVSGLLAINFLVGLLGRRGLAPFGWYRIALAAVLILLVSVKIL